MITHISLKVANTDEEWNKGYKAIMTWAKEKYLNSSNKDEARYEICKKLESLAIDSTVKMLPKGCSIKYGFPIQLQDHETSKKIRSVKVEAAGRIDIAGGWSDTPPITYDMESPAVVHAAILVDGNRPISVEISRLKFMSGLWVQTGEGTLRCFETLSEIIENATKPNESGSLICAGIVTSGVFDNLFINKRHELDDEVVCSKRIDYKDELTSGLFIDCHSDLPHGSGIGTSSILSGALLAGLWTLFGKKFTDNDLVRAVLKVEQYHTTKGGWQDQIGGLIPGIKLGTLSHDKDKHVIWKSIPLSDELEADINSRLVLLYTGKTRLAKNLLETVILNWIKGELEIQLAFKELVSGAQLAAKKLNSGIFPVEEITKYHELKKIVATGAEPLFVKELIEKMKNEKLIKTACISGAGGGGYLYVYLNKSKNINDLREFVKINQDKYPHLSVSSIKIDNEPLRIIKRY